MGTASFPVGGTDVECDSQLRDTVGLGDRRLAGRAALPRIATASALRKPFFFSRVVSYKLESIFIYLRF